MSETAPESAYITITESEYALLKEQAAAQHATAEAQIAAAQELADSLGHELTALQGEREEAQQHLEQAMMRTEAVKERVRHEIISLQPEHLTATGAALLRKALADSSETV